ncbi:MAG: flagellar basal body rod protein FlgB [Candidatus Kapaibacteriales bacterium]
MSIKFLLFKDRLPLMNKALDAYSRRMSAIAENIANVNTIGYNPKEVKFEEFFNKEKINIKLSNTDDRHIQPVEEARLSTVESNIPIGEEQRSGTNAVNIDKEMAKAAETQIRFRFVARLVRRYFSGLNSAITGTREM